MKFSKKQGKILYYYANTKNLQFTDLLSFTFAETLALLKLFAVNN